MKNGTTIRWAIGISITILVLFTYVITASVTAQNNITQLQTKDVELKKVVDAHNDRILRIEIEAGRADERQLSIMKSLGEIEEFIRTGR